MDVLLDHPKKKKKKGNQVKHIITNEEGFMIPLQRWTCEEIVGHERRR